MMIFSGWRAVVWLLVAVLIAGLLLTVVFWVGVLLAALAVVAWFNLLVLPNVAARLRTPERLLAIALLPLLAAGGLLLGGLSGLAASSAIWAIGVALPRVALWRLRRRLRQSTRAGTALRQGPNIHASF